MFSAAGSLTSPSGISTFFLGLPIFVLHPRWERFMDLAVYVVPGVHREFRLGNVVFAAIDRRVGIKGKADRQKGSPRQLRGCAYRLSTRCACWGSRSSHLIKMRNR